MSLSKAKASFLRDIHIPSAEGRRLKVKAGWGVGVVGFYALSNLIG